MQVRGLNPILTFTTVTAVLLAALAVYLFMGTGTTHADSALNPVYTTKYCNAMVGTFPDAQLQGNPACAENLTGGLNPGADLTTVLDLAATDLNFSSVVTFGPSSATINAMPTAGQKIGGLQSLTNLGVLNGACNQALVVDFIFYTVALPNLSGGSVRTSSNIIYPRNDGQTNRFGAWQVGSPPVNGGADNINDANSDLRADANEEAFANYPSYLIDLFDPTFTPGSGDSSPGDEIVPKAVYGGLTNVVGNWIPLYFAQFDPGQLAALPGHFSKMTSAMGAPNVSVLNDPTSVVVSPSSITDFCTPLNVTTVLLGQVAGGGATRATNPANGTQFSQQYVASLRDLDQDGYENAIDTCPTQTNAGNPRVPSSGDTDGDGIDNICDTSGLNNDEDGDSFTNRQDNCPKVANGGNAQTDSEIGAAPAADFGPKTDTMGDACDSGSVTFTQNGASNTVTLSSTVGNGRYHAKTNIVAKCFGATAAGGTDADADGYCAANDNAESGGCAPNCAFRHTGWSGASHPGLQMDTDLDLYSDTMETYLGTDPTKPCAQTSGTNNEAPLDNWPMDGNDSGTSNTIDVGGMLPLNPTVNVHPKGKRWDLNNDGIINTIDVGRFVAVLNKSCGSFSAPGGPTGIPAYAQQ